MLQTRSEEESLRANIPVIHYRFKRKLEFLNCHLQLYIADDKIKIIIICIEDYSNESKEYSNYFSLYQLQELSKYFKYFKKIEDILEDLANILQLNNYKIEKNVNTLTLILQVAINQEFGDIYLTLFKNKPNNNNYKKPSQIINNIKKSDNDNYDYNYKRKNLIYNPQNYNIQTENSIKGDYSGVKSIKELNNLLTDLKDRITVLEVTQNTSQNQNKNLQIKSNNYINNNFLMTNPGNINTVGTNSLIDEKMKINMDNIIKRINRLEEINSKKTQKIINLENKLKIYEPNFTLTENASYKDNNIYTNNNLNNDNNTIYLGSIKNKDTNTINTINSNNTNFNKTLLEVKEENNSSS